jgi:hypothetical protein
MTTRHDYKCIIKELKAELEKKNRQVDLLMDLYKSKESKEKSIQKPKVKEPKRIKAFGGTVEVKED